MILTTPPAPAAVAEDAVAQLAPQTETWTLYAPWLDRQWNLTDVAGAVVKTEGAILPEAKPEHRWDDSPLIAGSSWSGQRAPRSEAFIPLMLQGEDYAAFSAERASFFDALDPDHEAILRITQPDTKWREIALRWSDKERVGDLNTVASLFDRYGVTWAAADPHWSGAPVSVTFPFVGDDVPDFFEGPPYYFTPSSVIGNASVTNLGDVEAYWTGRIDGPFSGFTVGVGASLVTLTRTAALGEYVDIDMHPKRLTVTDHNGTDLRPLLSAFARSSLPRGVTQVTTEVNGASDGSAVTVAFTPRYRRWA